MERVVGHHHSQQPDTLPNLPPPPFAPMNKLTPTPPTPTPHPTYTHTLTPSHPHTHSHTHTPNPTRLDAAKPSFGELSVLTQLGEVLGKGVWRSLMVVLTHANAARDKLGGEYGQVRFVCLLVVMCVWL